MGLLDRIYRLPERYDNAEPNSIEEVGIEVDDYTNGTGVDLIKATPFRVNRTIINCRNAAKDPFVAGILMDNITKTNSYLDIECNDEKALAHIWSRDKDWKISKLVDDLLHNGMVDGTDFIEKYWKNNHLMYRWLAFDAMNYRMKKLYDDNGEVMGYKQLTMRNQDTNDGWLKKHFNELVENDKELVVNFLPEEIIEVKYMERMGKGHSIVMDILDKVHDKRVLEDLMLKIPYKNSNLVQLTMGNEFQPGKRLTQNDRRDVERVVSDYHNKGVITLPFGYEMRVLKGGALPDIPSYIKQIERNIFIGLNTPEAVFTSESSNRATADIQLDSQDSGRVLFLQYNREWVNDIIVNEIFLPELERNDYDIENIEIKLVFNKKEDNEDEEPEEPEDDDNSFFEHKPINKVGDDGNE